CILGRGQPLLQQRGRDQRAYGLDAQIVDARGVVGGCLGLVGGGDVLGHGAPLSRNGGGPVFRGLVLAEGRAAAGATPRGQNRRKDMRCRDQYFDCSESSRTVPPVEGAWTKRPLP